ncbi:MAG: hypothetical protein ABI822_32770, partial [Bryobacteraceae bacterium]
AFIAKSNSAGRLVYATYLGGSGDEEARAIPVDSAGKAYVTGVVHGSTGGSPANVRTRHRYSQTAESPN